MHRRRKIAGQKPPKAKPSPAIVPLTPDAPVCPTGVGVLDTGLSRSTCSWAPSMAQLQPRGGATIEANGEDPHEEAPHEEAPHEENNDGNG
jgi:hypothetical protein